MATPASAIEEARKRTTILTHASGGTGYHLVPELRKRVSVTTSFNDHPDVKIERLCRVGHPEHLFPPRGERRLSYDSLVQVRQLQALRGQPGPECLPMLPEKPGYFFRRDSGHEPHAEEAGVVRRAVIMVIPDGSTSGFPIICLRRGFRDDLSNAFISPCVAGESGWLRPAVGASFGAENAPAVI